MRVFTHVKCLCTFWKPSVSRQLTLYFLILGLLVFLLTSGAFMIAEKKSFIRSTRKLIQHQFSLMSDSNSPDFLWRGIDRSQPELYVLSEMVNRFSSTFYQISDVSIYCRTSPDGRWHRLFLTEKRILQTQRVDNAAVDRLDRSLDRRFIHPDINFFMSDETLSMFVDITREADRHRYFYKIEIDRQGISAIVHRKIAHFFGVTLIAVLLIRTLGYFFARRIAGPIERLSETAGHVAKGDLTRSIPVSATDEIGDLAESFNHMIQGLRERDRIRAIAFELEKGRQIQKNFLPEAIPDLPDWEISTCFYPAKEVSGDFYDVFTLPGGYLGLVIADVCDKGVGSALYMALFRSLIRVFSEQILSGRTRVDAGDSAPDGSDWAEPQNALNAVRFTNDYIARTHGEEGMFATLFFGLLEPSTGRLWYINAGHEPLVILGTDGIKATLGPTGPAVGVIPGAKFTVRQIDIENGEFLVGYTDGVTEARSPDDELFTRNRLRSLMAQPFASASELLEGIKAGLFGFVKEAPQSDDVTLLAVQRAAGQGVIPYSPLDLPGKLI